MRFFHDIKSIKIPLISNLFDAEEARRVPYFFRYHETSYEIFIFHRSLQFLEVQNVSPLIFQHFEIFSFSPDRGGTDLNRQRTVTENIAGSARSRFASAWTAWFHWRTPGRNTSACDAQGVDLCLDFLKNDANFISNSSHDKVIIK